MVDVKWLAEETPDDVNFFKECRLLFAISSGLIARFSHILLKDRVEKLELEECATSLRALINGLLKTEQAQTDGISFLLTHRRSEWRRRLWTSKLAVSRLLRDIISRFLDSHLVDISLRLAIEYNRLFDFADNSADVNVYYNTCPILLHPIRKLTATRLLQLLATKRAESTSYVLLEALLLTFEPIKVKETEKLQVVHQESVTSDTSTEIFKALTQHLHPFSITPDVHQDQLQNLVKMEEKRVYIFLNILAKVAALLLPPFCVKTGPKGEPKLDISVKKKLTSCYEDTLWTEVGSFLEHGLLWWHSDPFGCVAPEQAHRLRDYFTSLRLSDKTPRLVVAPINSLTDALCCHVTSTSWDHLFRTALESATKLTQLFPSADTGKHFVALLNDLVILSNGCENFELELEQLPLVEQIPILHRLDHSVHTTRLWVLSQCRRLANQWNVGPFYEIARADVTDCLEALNKLQLTDYGKIPQNTSVHVEVCAKMRTKLVSEVKVNIGKLRETPQQCMDILAKNCRTTCLAHLYLACPPASYWRQNGPLPDCASAYVENYLDCVLRPIFEATHEFPISVQISSTMMILRILCESWLEYIYLNRINFSEWGAVQLLTDFGAVPTWLMERIKMPKELLTPLLGHEVLKRCEGVGRLLLRRRGETIAMARSNRVNNTAADNMPAEMYVTNQEQWLELRASRNFLASCCQL